MLGATSERRPPRVPVSASGRLNARNSVSGSGRNIRNGSTMSVGSLLGRTGATPVTGIRNR